MDILLVGLTPPSTKIWMLFGSDDQTTPSALTLTYADARALAEPNRMAGLEL